MNVREATDLCYNCTPASDLMNYTSCLSSQTTNMWSCPLTLSFIANRNLEHDEVKGFLFFPEGEHHPTTKLSHG